MLIVVDNRFSSHNALGAVSDLRFRCGPVPPTLMEASVCTEHHQHPTTQTSPVPSASTDPHGVYKVHEVSLIADVERGPEN